MTPSRDDRHLETLAEAASSIQWSDLPHTARQHVARVFADTIGAIMGSARCREIQQLSGGDPPLFASPGSAQILVPGLPVAPPAWAGFVNGTAATFLELDEGGEGGHAAAHVVPAALAAAQAMHRPGADLLAAVVSGYEVAARLGEAYRLRPEVHGHGHFGTIGAAVSAARLTGADPVRAAQVAANLPLLTLQETCLEGATVRNTWTGVSAMLGLTASRLAAAGFTGSPGARAVGFGHVLGRLERPELLTEPVDADQLRILRNSIKFHSACFETHQALDAALLHGRLDPDQVDAILVESPEPQPNHVPNGTDLSNRFSVPYGVAAALVHGHTGPDAFVTDPRVTALARRVTVAVASVPRQRPTSKPARVTVTTVDGRRETHTIDHPYGAHPRRASPEDLESKFCSLVWAHDPARLYRLLLAVAEVVDVTTLFDDVT